MFGRRFIRIAPATTTVQFFFCGYGSTLRCLETHAAGWHLSSIACQVVATCLVFRVVRQLAEDRALAFVAALIFGLHPAHIENVAWISGVTDPLMACFVLGSFSVFLSFRQSGGAWRVALSLVLFALGLLTKETAIVLPLLILAFVTLVNKRETSAASAASERYALLTANETPALQCLRPSLRALLGGFGIVVVTYLAARFHALRGWSHSTITLGWKDVFLTWPAVLWFYVKHLVWPVGLSEFYSLDYVSHFNAATVLAPLGLLLVVAVITVLALSLIRDRSEKSLAQFALVLMAVPLLPVLDLRSLTAGDIVHDRYLYLPSVGFALLLALVIRQLARRFAQSRYVFAVTTGGLGLALAVATISQQMQWASDILLYSRGLVSAPANLTVRDNLANALFDANQPGRAIPLYLEVLSRNPGFWRSNYNLGVAYYKTGNFNGAEEYLKRAIRLDPGDSDQYIYLALTELQLRNLDAAVENARRAIALNPRARGYHLIAGMIAQTRGDRAKATAEFRTEVAEHPDNVAAVTALQELQANPPLR